MHLLAGRAGSLVIAAATAVGIVALVLPLFLNPLWVSFEQGRAEAAAWTGLSATDLRTATDAILADLVIGPPDFDVEAAGSAVLNERERGHMRDVRTVFMGFFGAAAILAIGAVGVVLARRRTAAAQASSTAPRSWLAVRAGALTLIGLLVVGGVVALVAFDTLFEVFHQLLFPGGSYTFDPATERLVQLFPFRFWQESAIAVGVVAIAVALGVAWWAGRRARTVAPRPDERPSEQGTAPASATVR